MPVVDLFCGCGGLSKGFEQAGFSISAAFDSWQPALTCYNANFKHKAQKLDLGTVDVAVKTIRSYSPTIIIGGPPCQEFSNAGKREEGALADLTYNFAQIVTEIKPAYFVMENVPRAKKSNAYQKARMLYKANDYGLTEIVLDASRCGAPQKRSRFFCIGALNANDNFLLGSVFREYTDKAITVRQYFEEKGIALNGEAYYRHPTTYSRRAVFSVDEVAPTVRGVNRPKPPTYKHHPKDAVPENQLAEITHLSLRERAVIQTFPTDFKFDDLGINRCDLEQMVGNAVPVMLSFFVAQRLKEYIQESQKGNSVMTERQAFSEWLRTEKQYSDRSISDVFSRLKRAEDIRQPKQLDKHYIVDLENEKKYQDLSTSVRSQIRVAIKLKMAFMEQRKAQEVEN